MHDVITRPVRVANVTEWAKRPECWSRVLDIDWELPDQLARRTDRSVRSRSPRAPCRPQTSSETDRKIIVAVAAIPATDWFAVARWAKETHNLQPWQRQIAFTIGQYLSKGWDISDKQAVQARVSHGRSATTWISILLRRLRTADRECLKRGAEQEEADF